MRHLKVLLHKMHPGLKVVPIWDDAAHHYSKAVMEHVNEMKVT